MKIRICINFCLMALVLAARRQNHYIQNPRHQHAQNVKQSNCAPGWTAYHNSCYYYERNMMTFDKAEVQCLEKDSLMFIAETVEEWREVMKNTPENYFTWAGLKQHEDDREAKWVSGRGIRAEDLDWLSPAFKGWNENAKCVARFNSAYSKYSYFFYCGSLFYSVCERNSTLLHNIWDEGARGF